MGMLRRVALALIIIGALNWGLIGFFSFDLVATIFGGQNAPLSRLVYGLVGISGLMCIGLLFEPGREIVEDREDLHVSKRLVPDTEFGEEPDFTKIVEVPKKTEHKNQPSAKKNNHPAKKKK